MTHEQRRWLFWVLVVVFIVLTIRIVRNQLIIARNDREIKRLKHKAMEDAAEAALWVRRRKEAADDAERGGYILCGRCKLRRVENYPGSTMCTWCGI